MTNCNFGAAAPDEAIVHGACRPGYRTRQPQHYVDAWLQTMQDNSIDQVCCLLGEKLQRYDNLLKQYTEFFGPDSVCHAPVEDYSVVSESTLIQTIWPFLTAADCADSSTVVHCSAGQGRTGQILVLWLAAEREYILEEAIQTVRRTGRSPLEAATQDDLQTRLSAIIGDFRR